MGWAAAAIPAVLSIVDQMNKPQTPGPIGGVVKSTQGSPTPSTLGFVKPTVGSVLGASGAGADNSGASGSETPPYTAPATGNLDTTPPKPDASLAVGDAGNAGEQGVAGEKPDDPNPPQDEPAAEGDSGNPLGSLGIARLASGMGGAIASANNPRGSGPIGGLIHAGQSPQGTLPDIRQRLMQYLASMGR